jgi:hypothetical protein
VAASMEAAPRTVARTVRWTVVSLSLAALGGCAHMSAGPDAPVPPAEPRATLLVRLDLWPAQRCQQEFDLLLYRNRGVDLVEWQAQRDVRRGDCDGRTAAIRYLPQRLLRVELLAEIERLAQHVEAQGNK